jgi:broad specificity phosphatase PhoE
MGIVLLVRHGQASFGAEDYDVLSDVGVAQGATLGRALAAADVTPTLVVSGAMRRQRETAEGMIGAAGWTVPLETDDRWDEFDHLKVVETYAKAAGDIPIETHDPRAFQVLFERSTGRWASAGYDDEYDESFEAFTVRVRAALAEACRAADSGSTVVVLSSGGAIAAAAAMLTSVSERPQRLSAPWQRLNAVMVNTSVTRVVVGSTGARLLTFNEHAHLTGDAVTYR